jgi:hypothetical protein
MKITRTQLRKLILESVVEFPTGKRLKQLLNDLRNGFLSYYDEGDTSMVAYGLDSWAEQVNNAIDYVKDEVGNDLSLFDQAADQAEALLIDGRFHPMSDYNVLARASDVEDQDDEFANFLDNLESGDIEEFPYYDDY